MSGLSELVNIRQCDILRNEKKILENIEFNLFNSDLTFVIGNSGSGKSSFLKSLYGALEIKGEQAKILGKELTKISARELQILRRNLGLIFQDFKIFEKLSVFDNLSYFLKSIGHKDKEENEVRIMKMLEKVKIEALRTRKAYELSGGEKQRLAIARALIHEPKIIIADEPTGNLNYKLGVDIFKLLANLALEQGSSVITATHDEELASLFSAKIYKCENRLIKRIS